MIISYEEAHGKMERAIETRGRDKTMEGLEQYKDYKVEEAKVHIIQLMVVKQRQNKNSKRWKDNKDIPG